MNGFLISIFENLVSNAIWAVLGVIGSYFFYSYVKSSKQRDSTFSGGHSAKSAATMINQLIALQDQLDEERQKPKGTLIEHKITVDDRRSSGSTSSSNDDDWGYIIILFAIMFMLGYIWTNYFMVLFYILLVIVGFGFGSSVFYLINLRKFPPPYATEDLILSIGGSMFWLGSAVISIFAVFYPVYPSNLDELNLTMVHATQAIGMFILIAAAIAMLVVQLSAGIIYHNAVNGEVSHRIWFKIWKSRMWVFGGLIIALVFAFLFAPGTLYTLLF